MFRFYWKSNRNEQSIYSDFKRWEGGFFFIEELNNGTRNVYEVIDRKILPNSSNVLEILKERDENFSQKVGWLHESPLQQIFLQKDNLFSHVLVFDQKQHLNFVSGPLNHPFPSWVIEVLGAHYNEVQRIVNSNKFFVSSSNPTYHEQHQPLNPKQKEVSLLQKKQPSQSSYKIQNTDLQIKMPSSEPKSHSVQSLQPLQQVRASGSPRTVQTGSLCQPISLPDEQPPRKSIHRPRVHHKNSSQVRSKECLIDLSQS